MQQKFLVLKLGDFAWLSYVQKKRKKGSISITVKKEIATALAIRKGQPVYSYVGKELETNRDVIIVYTDGKERDGCSEDVDEWRHNGGAGYAGRKVCKG